MTQNPGDTYKKYVAKRLAELRPALMQASVGDFSSKIRVPKHEDEFTELFVGLKVILETAGEKVAEVESELEKRTLAEEKIKENEQLLHNIINTLPIILMVINTKGKISLCEGRGLKVIGIKETQAIGKSIFRLYRHYPVVIRSLERALKGEEMISISEVRNIAFQTWYLPIKDDSNNVVDVIMMSQDITDRVNQKRQLDFRESQFKTLTENSPDIIIRFDKNMHLLYVNTAIQEIIDMAPEVLINQSINDLHLPKSQLENMKKNVQLVLKTGKSKKLELDLITRKGQQYFQTQLVPEVSVDGSIESVLSVSRNITDLKMKTTDLQEALSIISAERATAEAERVKDNAILASIGEGMVVTDSKGKVSYMNHPAEVMMGWTLKEIEGHQWAKDIPAVINEQKEPIPYSLSTTALSLKGKTATNSYYYTRKDGSVFPVTVTGAPVILAKKIIGSIIVFRDISREKEIDKMKNEFISIASHELRTPMTAIKGYLSMILEGDFGPVEPELRDALDTVNHSTERLIKLVNDMLDVSRLESGRQHFEISKVKIQPIVKDIMSMLGPLTKDKNLAIKIAVNPWHIVQADAAKTKQILSNLIGNALKLTQKGSITITSKVNKNNICVEVRDTGIGITKKNQKKLFGKFQQFFSSAPGYRSGTGLGLYISQQFARKMGGDVFLKESSVGKGSTFVLKLPQPGTQEAEVAKWQLAKEENQSKII